MEQELFDLFLHSKKALLTGQGICEEANNFCEASERCTETMEKIHPKLLFVNNYILAQLVTLERMREYNDLKVEEFKTKIKANQTNKLTNIFNLLKQRTIDKDILKVNKERGQGDGRVEKKVTLFDHISDEAIIELQRQADDEIGEMEMINNVLENQSRNIALAVSELASMREATLITPLEEPLSFAHEKLRIQGRETEKMAEILTDFTKHYDQIVEATKIYQSSPEACDDLDITILEEDNEHIPDILGSLRDSLAIVQSIAQVFCQREIGQEQMKVLDELEYFGTSGQADVICEKIMDAEVAMKNKECSLDDFFQQLSSLAERYRFYASSYSYLLLEIERRKKAQIKLMNLRKEMIKVFEEAYDDELQERKSWSAQHGEYLPEVLCPFINDLPTKLTVTVESESGRLPNLSPESIEKALNEIHNAS
ncbi:hypothetical protein G6F62_003714 [Rhizopus arrhizus]|nr:hypothetical protein G6F23_004760 [Rhizopus arrhizus]KAG0760759.1 hypothetical protein G6F24_008076 [Rhizopus arrhizus]KAG0787139.1 hypothetical protein G6F21_008109 [Rhizopus arrhizus]KAG0800448.1 hypothetical protein G6F22_002223 [Rhizopus arrhizus]KAG0808876.1 hypothetical protein G6F20_009224 [Rhizopus arrhizus]